MQKKQIRIIPKGMNRDISISKGNQEFSYENKNIRISVNKDSNLLTISNEQSTEEVLPIDGIILGHCVIQDRCVIFSKTETNDIISLFTPGEDLKNLFQGNLNFNVEYPIEAIGLVETENIHKVYWVDGINIPRVINIIPYISNTIPPPSSPPSQVYTGFDVTCELKGEEEITIDKSFEGVGSFPSGTIQYAFSYFNNFGKESAIFHVTPQYYMTYIDRGASPEDKTTQVFKIKIDNLQQDFDNIRIYSIQRTSIQATPNVNRVADLPIKGKSSTSFTDTNRNVESIDPSLLLYLGSDNIIPYTFTHKDGTLFLGNYFLDRGTLLEEDWLSKVENGDIKITTTHKEKEIPYNSKVSQYYFEFELNYSEKDITSFRKDENYKLGIQFRHKNGKYSIPIFLGYYQPTKNIEINEETFRPTRLSIELPEAILTTLKAKGYISIIPLVEFPQGHERRFICQGALNPTIYNVGDRQDNSPYTQKSWFFRPNPPLIHLPKEGVKIGSYGIAEYRHNKHTFTIEDNPANAELANNQYDDESIIDYNKQYSWKPRRNRYAIDRSIVTLDSPESTMENLFLSNENTHLEICGIIPLDNANRKYKITTSIAPYVNEQGISSPGFNSVNIFRNDNISNIDAYKTLLGSAIWEEFREDERSIISKFFVYPFHNTGGIASWKGGKEVYSKLETKKLFNYRYSKSVKYLDIQSIELEDSVVVDDSQNKLFQFTHKKNKRFYKNWIDKVVYGAGSKLGVFQEKYNALWANSVDVNIPTNSVNFNPFSGIGRREDAKYIEPVSIKYKGSKHILLSLKNSILPLAGNSEYIDNIQIEDISTIEDKFYSGLVLNGIIGKEDSLNLKFLLQDYIVGISNSSFNVSNRYELNPEENRFTAFYKSTYNPREVIGYSNKFDINIIRQNIVSKINEYLEEKEIPIKAKLIEYKITGDSFMFDASGRKLPNELSGDLITAVDFIGTNSYFIHELPRGERWENLARESILYVKNKYNDTSKLEFANAIKDVEFLDPEVSGYNPSFTLKIKGDVGTIKHFLKEAFDFAHKDDRFELPFKESHRLYNDVPGEKYFWQEGDYAYLKVLAGGVVISEGVKHEEYKERLIQIFEHYIGSFRTLYTINSKSLFKFKEHIQDRGFLLLGNLIRNIDINRLKAEINPEKILWQQAGEEVLILSNKPTTVFCDYGDIFYQRYNCVGTLPISEKDENQIIDVLSFMVETRVNLNGVYDRNRGNTDFYNITEDNYNKINPVYSQPNNFFNWRIPNRELFKNKKYNSQITWTKQKNFGEEIDTWTHITGISTVQLDGDKGEIQKLIKYNDNIFSFQDNGIANIMFNSRVQIPVSDGVPIEISNGYKVEGFRYISDIIGCRNKWTVANTRAGLTFIDDNSDILYIFSEEGIQPVSEMTGFRTYLLNRSNKQRYTPLNNGTITFFDDYRGDIYYINDKALNYSITLRNFESFFDYQDSKAMFNIKDGFYSIANGRIWRHRGNTFNRLHGRLVPFSVEYKVNPEGMKDKIFTNIEYRADSFTNKGYLKDNIDLETIEINTEYQSGKNKLKYSHIKPSNNKKRFRVWRADFPRQKGTMNRIRNPWANLKLISKLTEDKTEIHDLTVTYYEN